MGLSCSCDDFDKRDHDSWWEPGRRSVPPAGERCCECNALLPEGEKRASIMSGEVYDPGEIEPQPRPPWDVDADEMDDDAFAAVESTWDIYCDKYGWDSDCERFERYTSEYRCERCEDLADAIEGLGYCMIAPGDLPSAHAEYVNEHAEQRRHPIIWKPDPDGVWHPRPELAEDRMIAEITRRWRRTMSWLRWGWRSDLRWKVWFPAQTKVMRALGYELTYERYDSATRKSIYRWTRRERKLPPWLREATR